MVFDGGVLTPEQTAQIRLAADELRSWAWCTEQEASERLSELLAPDPADGSSRGRRIR
ncbi:hypothetical protein GCM10010166_18690 [Couchioplanes caeruleus subsp. azureus]|nr:hypothetical protein GCM10010166_18690 [Couchioplanes caeruleus subsp. azureus]